MLTIVPTPIGNLKDITLRALEVLQSADLILCEDTRTSSKLLKHFDIQKPLMSYHMHNEHRVVEDMVNRIQAGQQVVLISDAGTPGISDPGFLLVRACIQANIPVTCLPGATALIPALVQSGFPTDSFLFEGFLPQKKGRKTKLEQLAQEKRTIILYESPYRLVKLLEEIQQYFGAERLVAVSRELSKMYEETIRGTAEELLAIFQQKTPKGEIVVVISK